MKPLFSSANGVMGSRRFIGAVGLSAMALAAHAEVTIYAEESGLSGSGRLERAGKVLAEPMANSVTDIGDIRT